MIFVDTNYFLRYLRNDIPRQSEIANDLFIKAARSEIKLCTSLIVFFEIFWVMDRFYQESKSDIIGALNELMELDFLILPEKRTLQMAIDIFEKSNLELEDCYNFAFALEHSADDFRTFDKKLRKHVEKSGLIF